MCDLKEFFSVLEKHAPLKLSHELVSRGDYDNSGIIINHHQEIKKVLFSLDLSERVVEKAKRLKCDTVVTHHPAIYTPINRLDCEGDTKAVTLVIASGLNVISMHLNLDYAEFGIDYFMSKGLGAIKAQTLDELSKTEGYGRVAEIDKKTFRQVRDTAKKTFKTDKILCYGNLNENVEKIASFCGSGGNVALKFLKENKILADLIVTSDAPHHVIKEIVESGKKLMLLTHYSAENYGFKKYFDKISSLTAENIESFYFEDKRFM